MASDKPAKAGSNNALAMLNARIAESLGNKPERSPEEVVSDIVERNLSAHSLDELFTDVLSAKDDFVNVPFICEGLEFQKSEIAGTEYYAVLSVRRSDDSHAVVTCSAPDVYSKLLAMQGMGVMDSTPVVIVGKTTEAGYTVLKLDRVDRSSFESGEAF